MLRKIFKKTIFFSVLPSFLLGGYLGYKIHLSESYIFVLLKDFYLDIRIPDKKIDGKIFTLRDTLHNKKHSENFIVENIDKEELKSIKTNWLSRNDFQEFIKSSLGMNKLKTKNIPSEFSSSLRENSKRKYESGSISENSIDFVYPEISVRYLHAEHSNKRKKNKLIVIIHGHGSSAHKVMGLDNKDYMNELGKTIFKKGYDVIAFDAISNSTISGYLSSQLLLYGINIYGLHTKAIVDLAESENIIKNYEDVYLYGFSNGAFIVNFCSILDGKYSKIIVDDNTGILSIKGNKTYHREQEYSLYFLRPFWEKVKINDMAKFSKNGTFFTTYTDVEYLERKNLSKDLLFFEAESNDGISIIPKKYSFHVPEEETILNIFRE